MIFIRMIATGFWMFGWTMVKWIQVDFISILFPVGQNTEQRIINTVAHCRESRIELIPKQIMFKRILPQLWLAECNFMLHTTHTRNSVATVSLQFPYKFFFPFYLSLEIILYFYVTSDFLPDPPIHSKVYIVYTARPLFFHIFIVVFVLIIWIHLKILLFI